MGRWLFESDGPMWLVVVVVIAGAAYTGIMAGRESAQFKAWAATHCKVIGKMDGSYAYAPGKPHLAYSPGKTGYQCDDGMTYWK